MSVTVEMIPGIIEEAKAEAFKAADQFFNKELGGEDKYYKRLQWRTKHVEP